MIIMKKRILSDLICAALLAGILSSCAITSTREVDLYNSNETADFGPYKHYFSTLTEVEKAAYNCIIADIENFPRNIQVPTMYTEQLERVWMAIMYDNPELLLLGKDCGMEITAESSWFYCDYALEKSEYIQKKQRLEKKVEQIKKDLEEIDGAFAKELYIHDLIIDNCEYVSSNDMIQSTAYGALIDGKASCEGYAKAAKILLDAAGIENYLMCGVAARDDGSEEGHMWNVVIIDGQPYNLDVTWDDPIGESNANNKRYSYFNITDEEIKKTHTFDEEPADCTATEENYFIKTEKVFETYDANMKTSLSSLIAKVGEEKKLSIRFSSEEAYKKAIKGLFDNQEIYGVLEVAAKSSKEKFSTKKITYINDDTHYVLELILVEPEKESTTKN